MTKQVLRVGILNNFNYSDKEFEQLKELKKEWNVFVNSNSFSKVRGNLPAIVTINPYLTKFQKPKGRWSLIKAARIKYVFNPTNEVQDAFDASLSWTIKKNIPALITFMRFKTKKDLFKYTTKQNNYEWKNSFFRPKRLNTRLPSLENIYYCDIKRKGCSACGNCAKLTYGIDTEDIYGINLSSSGYCTQNCPSCFAKAIVVRCKKLAFNKVTQNKKQKKKLDGGR